MRWHREVELCGMGRELGGNQVAWGVGIRWGLDGMGSGN